MSELGDLYGRLVVPAELGSLAPLREMVTQAATQAGLPSARIGDLDVALEEIVVNIINYAYSNGGGDIEVCCGLRPGRQFFVVCIDEGRSFSLKLPNAESTRQKVKNLQAGGQGLYLVGQLVDDVQYARKGEKNILTLLIGF